MSDQRGKTMKAHRPYDLRRSAVTLLALILIGTAVSCTTPARVESQVRIEMKGTTQLGIMTITGRIERGPEDSLEVVTDWDAKNRASHRIIGDFSTFLQDKVGDIIMVDCIVLTTYSTWRKDIVIVSVHPFPSPTR